MNFGSKSDAMKLLKLFALILAVELIWSAHMHIAAAILEAVL